ncbi:MAG: hypothetical protein ABSD96_04125 [Candidatus Korobacteraceae bacterium]|jgi:hypothetical protein
MKNESITRAVKESSAAVACGKERPGVVPIAAVSRALGYTESELFIAGDILNRFVWRYPEEPSRKNVSSMEAEVPGSLSGREHAA